MPPGSASDLEQFISEKFAVAPDAFLQALRLSPNAQGYIIGAITELVLRDRLRAEGFEVQRIREKWEGRKHESHHGDFYIRRQDSEHWYVLESKGVKSNSEKWHNLFNRTRLETFLIKYRSLTPFATEGEVRDYIASALPRFSDEWAEPLYSRADIEKYTSTRGTAKARRMIELRSWPPEVLARETAKRIGYVRSKVNVAETHFVSGGSKVGRRTQATPRADEFHLLSLDLFLRTGGHDFVFVNPKDLARSQQDPAHLQQNYVVDILLTGVKETPSPAAPWSTDIHEVFETLTDPVDEVDMQVDDRSVDEIAAEGEELGGEAV